MDISTLRRYRDYALRTTDIGLPELPPFDRTMVRATEWLLAELSLLVNSSPPSLRAHLQAYITDRVFEGSMVDRCLKRLYQVLYVYVHVEECGLTDDHLEWIARMVVMSVLHDFPTEFNSQALPREAAKHAMEVTQRLEAYALIQTIGVEAVKSRIRQYALSNMARVQSKALARF